MLATSNSFFSWKPILHLICRWSQQKNVDLLTKIKKSSLSKVLCVVEKQTSQSIKMMKTDRNREFLSTTFSKFCKTQGILWQLRKLIPHQNRVVERRNQTILEQVWSILILRHVSTSLWPEAAKTMVYLLNQPPTRVNLFSFSPEEKISSKWPNLNNLRIFGSLLHVHVEAHARNKLELRSTVGSLVGYDNQSKAYRIYLPSANKIIVSKDVKFDKMRFYRI